MPKGGGSKTPQLDHFPLSTDMVEKQGGKKVRLKKHTPTPIVKDLRLLPQLLLYTFETLKDFILATHLNALLRTQFKSILINEFDSDMDAFFLPFVLCSHRNHT